MIYDTNTTGLSDREVKIIEGYTEPADIARALYENALAHEAMFQAMLDIDAKEIALTQESASADAVEALNESAAAGLWKKIVSLWHKFIDKVGSIQRTLTSRMAALAANGTEQVNKYESVVDKFIGTKKNGEKLKNISLKIKKYSLNAVSAAAPVKVPGSVDAAARLYNENDAEIWKSLTGAESAKAYGKALNGKIYEDKDTENITLADVPGSPKSFMAEVKKTLKGSKTLIKQVSDDAEADIRKARELARSADSQTEGASKEADKAAHAYKVCNICVSALLVRRRALINATVGMFQFCLGTWKKVVAAASGVDECAIEMIGEAAEEEVEDVIVGATAGDAEGITDLSLADTNLTDKDVSDDPNELTYDDTDCYTAHEDNGKPDGTIETNINSREESAFDFGAPIF